METATITANQSHGTSFPPVVAVLGHVDHGKTSLLDAIRQSNIAEREHGGITQKIGTSTIETIHDGTKRFITFIDTPGHATFSNMRSRGAKVADIGLLIVAGDDGVKPQTKESIEVLKDSQIPFIVVITKSDLPHANIEKVKQELLRENILLEGYGGDVPVIEVSSKTGHNIKELLDLILLVQDLHPVPQTVTTSAPFQGVVIESKLDQRTGPKATIIIKNGTLAVRDEIVAENTTGKVRTILNDEGKQVQTATVGDGVEVLGFEQVPSVGSLVQKKGEVQAEIKASEQAEAVAAREPTVQELLASMEDTSHQELNVILAADTEGSLEAIEAAFPEGVKILLKKTGELTEGDVLMAKSAGGIVLGFNTKIRPNVERLAQTEKVLVRNYTIIYEMIDEVSDALEGKKLQGMEVELGRAKILATFPYEKTIVLGVSVLDGRVARGDKVRIERGDEEIGTSTITSVRQGKNQTSKVEAGQECGIIISPELDITIGDVVICFR